jgi:L-ascorbate metabolism protein UlaG (beta-lactamase superfamily)
MHLHLVRHATLRLQYAGLTLLIDPQLDPAGARDPVPGTPNPRPTPLVELPEPAEVVATGLDAVLVTHTHTDHFDATAAALLPRDVPLLVQPPDADLLRGRGFADVRPVADELTFGGLRVTRTDGEHGHGAAAERMAPVSGFVLHAAGEPVVYVAGDTVWCAPVRAALDAHRPDVVVLNAGAATLLDGGPITMTAEDVLAVARHAPAARIVAVHLDTVSHAVETRADLHQRLQEAGLKDRVTVPEDGAEVPLG